MDILLALLLQSAIAPEGPATARGPQLSYAGDAAAEAPRPRINQGRRFQIDWNAMDDSLTGESRQERRPAAPARAPARPAPNRTSMWNGVPVRMINGQPHGLW